MTSEEQDKRIRKLEELLFENGIIENKDKRKLLSFSKIKLDDLDDIFDIRENFDKTIFNNWLNNNISISNDNIRFLEDLLNREGNSIKFYNEEDLKMKFLSPIFNNIQFTNLEYEIRDFYEYNLTYKSDNFILSGVTDFVISKGIKKPKKPYFFIQEFKKGFENTNPEPQLLAELISAVEINDEISIRGAYIIGAIWNFVILEKLGKNKYRYFVSSNFDSTKIDDLKDIYKSLLFIKNEIIERVKLEETKD